MNWLTVAAILCVAALAAFAMLAALQHGAHRNRVLAEFRALNVALVQGRFGKPEPAAGGPWHSVLASEERLIVAAGTGAVLGLQQTLLLQDDAGRRWQVVAAHQMGTNPYLDVREPAADTIEPHGSKEREKSR
jgi:hypothetical protein